MHEVSLQEGVSSSRVLKLGEVIPYHVCVWGRTFCALWDV